MKDLIKHIEPELLESTFSTEEECYKYLANIKWQDGYECRKCGHTNYCAGKMPYSRRCTKCKSEESATSHTIFHRCRVYLPDAFRITFTVCRDPEISTYELSRRFDLRQMTCWKLKKKIMECAQKPEPDRDLVELFKI